MGTRVGAKKEQLRNEGSVIFETRKITRRMPLLAHALGKSRPPLNIMSCPDGKFIIKTDGCNAFPRLLFNSSQYWKCYGEAAWYSVVNNDFSTEPNDWDLP
jgi:hypothetical protein